MPKVVIIFVALLFSFYSSGQTLSTKKKKAIELYKEAENYRVRVQLQRAVQLYQMAIDKDKNFIEAYFRLGQTWDRAGERGKAIANYYQAFELLEDKSRIPELNYELAKVFMLRGDLKKSETHAGLFLKKQNKPEKQAEIKKLLIDIEYTRKNPPKEANIIPEDLREVNKFPMQYFPMVTADNLALLYTKRGPEIDEDIYVSLRDSPEEKWGSPFPVSPNINTEANEGTCTMTTDKRTLIFTSCQARGGYGSCDLYISYRLGNEWSWPENMGDVVNSPYWDSQPSLSANGDVLFFISERPGGVGGKDIWYSEKNLDEEWSKPQNMGTPINTPLDEVAPFIQANGLELYYSSNGYPGYGGFDIFKYNLVKKPAAPHNIGFPINTAEDQVGFFISPEGTKAYYSLDRQGGYGISSRIYTIDLPKTFIPEYTVSYVYGKVTDEETVEPIDANVTLYDVDEDSRVSGVRSDSLQGDYKIVLTEGSRYALYIFKEGYIFESLTFDYDSGNLKPIRKDIALRKIKNGSRTVLRNIFFDSGSSILKEESKTELDIVKQFIQNYPDFRFEISGHTDDVGSEEDNMSLSLQRAETVHRYLIEQGVPTNAISMKGYGESMPLVPNSTDENRKLNRRIEFEVIK